WSPDGSRLLYYDHVGVWTVDAHGDHRGFITHSAVAVLWSPDGGWVMVRRGSNDGERVFVMRTDGSGSTQVASGPVEILAWQGLERCRQHPCSCRRAGAARTPCGAGRPHFGISAGPVTIPADGADGRVPGSASDVAGVMVTSRRHVAHPSLRLDCPVARPW